LYDIIPYVLEAEYLWDYRTARNKGCSRKGALRHAFLRFRYITVLKLVTRQADKLIAISQHTKEDFVKHVGVKPDKISVCLLGVGKLPQNKLDKPASFSKYVSTSWGYIPRKFNLPDTPYLLYVGGADPRRRLADLVAALNNLRARGHEINLVLAGDTMLGAFNVPNIRLQQYLKHTSYLDNIYFLGFVDEPQKQWLYKNALAFVYPSIYEGFGLPMLEAMAYGTPVITYKNSSITEVSGDAAIYVNGFSEIISETLNLAQDNNYKNSYAKLSEAQSKKFAWAKTAEAIIAVTKSGQN